MVRIRSTQGRYPFAMDFDSNSLVIKHDEAENRFEIELGNELAVLTYRRYPDRMVINHTRVPQAFGRRGIAARLTRASLEYARTENLRVVPACSYAAHFIRKHPEFQDLLTPDDLSGIVTG
jgi:uncharacterized protein